jgi:DNA integrity scanning protein DisA with diadenylate cyclase activity
MEKSFNKSENIRKATEVYKNNPKFIIRSTAIIYYYAPQSIINRLTEKYRSVFNKYTFSQCLTLIEEYVLIIYIS